MYNPGVIVAQSLPDLVAIVNAEFNALADELQSPLFAQITMQAWNTEFPKPRTGMIVFADGVNWDPGEGAGLYGYANGQWFSIVSVYALSRLSDMGWDLAIINPEQPTSAVYQKAGIMIELAFTYGTGGVELDCPVRVEYSISTDGGSTLTQFASKALFYTAEGYFETAVWS